MCSGVLFFSMYVGVEVNMENENIILISNNLLNECGPDVFNRKGKLK